MEYKVAFGRAVKSYRNQRGFSQEEIAHRLDMSRQNVSKTEVGSRQPTLETIMKFAEVLKVEAPDLINRMIEIYEEEDQ